MKPKYIPEIFQEIDQAFPEKEKIALIRKYGEQDRGVQQIFRTLFQETEWMLPPGAPPFKLNPPKTHYSLLKKLSLQYFPVFIRGRGFDDLPQHKRERIFMKNVLESLEPREANFLIDLKDDRILTRYKSITHALVHKALPKVVQNPQKE